MNPKLATLLLFALIPVAVFSAPGTDFEVGKQPTRMTFDGEHVWVTNSGSHTVTKIRTSDGESVGEYPVGQAPVGVIFDGENDLGGQPSRRHGQQTASE